jgi:hypothetical protein
MRRLENCILLELNLHQAAIEWNWDNYNDPERITRRKATTSILYEKST